MILRRVLLLLLVLTGTAAEAGAQTVAEPIGQRVIDLTPPVPRPDTKRCVVELFARREFQGDAPLPIAYRPPADCPGPWSKVVLEGDFDVTPGTQFDRSADLVLGGVSLFLGTTMEPDERYAPRWRVERDVSDYAALLRRPADGAATLVNYLDADHDAHAFWGARLVFYAGAAPEKERIVLPVTEGFVRLDPQQPIFSRTLQLPRNLTRVEIDLFAIGQQRDEFWFDCAPGNLALRNVFGPAPCAAPFREVEVRIDGQLAGVRSIQPAIFTGGINPALWRRAPALDALNLPSARVDLTPFAGLLNDGKPHVVALAMPMAGTFFRVSATLIGEVDPDRAVVPGGLIANTIAPAKAPTRQVRRPRSPGGIGTIETIANRSEFAEGYVETSRGRVTTRVAYALDQRLITTRDTGKSSKRYDARQSVTITTAGGKPTHRRIDEHDTLSIDIGVKPPLYGVKNGTRIAQSRERTATGEGDRDTHMRQTITSFAPSFSFFTDARPTPNRVTVTSLVEDLNGRRQVEAVVADDQVTRSERDLGPPVRVPGKP